jgi:hypothetical protein
VSITATNYIRNINTNFPVPGKDNSTNVFRNNWSNIAGALSEINSQTNHLSLYAVDVTNTSTTFFGNTIENVSLANSSLGLVDNGILAGDITVDFSQGNYQKITLTAGLHNVTIVNWPQQGKAAELTLSFTALNPGASSVNFVNAVDLGPAFNPYLLDNTTNLFKIYSEFSALSTQNTIFVQKLSGITFNSTSTTTQISTNYVVRHPSGNSSADQILRISTATGAYSALTLSGQISGNVAVSNVALVPNIIKTTIVFGNWSSPTSTTASTFQVVSAINIIPGAIFNLPTTSSNLLVTSVTTNTVTCTPPFPTGIGTGEVIFKNPTPNTYGGDTAFPIVATISKSRANTSTGAVGTFTGAIFADANHLEITYNDQGVTAKNTFILDTLAVTTATDRSFTLANTEFVHRILPYGSIIMWYGSVASIPYGWHLCDGTGNTPDLTDNFVVGAGGTYTVGATGGRTDTVLPQHTHNVIEPQNDGNPGHKHAVYYYAETGGGKPTGTGASTNPTTTGYNTEYAETGITIENSGLADVTTTNLPPYYALCYIMKVTG